MDKKAEFEDPNRLQINKNTNKRTFQGRCIEHIVL